MGDAGRALRIAGTVDITGLSAERQARMLIDVARAHAQRRQAGEAVAAAVEIGRDHGLPEPSAIGPDGRMSETAGGLAGLTQDEAERRILDWLREHDQLSKRESYRHAIALCERCKSRIEPLISLQWWCSMDGIKQPALEALRARRVAYHPESQHRFAIDSLENAPDWCISRQLWWGHRLPLWECPDGHVTVEESTPSACAECGSTELKQSDDVLDTWFSSALWPFAILGWPGSVVRSKEKRYGLRRPLE